MNYNRFSHIYLYAKNWYKKSEDRMEDLKKICNHIYGHNVVTTNDVFSILSSMSFDHIMKAGNSGYEFERFVKALNPESFENKLFGKKDQSFEDRFLNASLSIIGLCEVRVIDGELAEPDENILPLSQNN